MHALGRTFSVLGGLLLASVVAGCAGSADGVQGSAANLTANAPAPASTLTDKVKAAYEEAVKGQKSYFLPGETAVKSADTLPGNAKVDFDNDAETSKGYGYGYPDARVATVDGQTVYAISGIVSDTGDIVGFYDAKGNELCEAYSGQGEQDGPGGVDWWK